MRDHWRGLGRLAAGGAVALVATMIGPPVHVWAQSASRHAAGTSQVARAAARGGHARVVIKAMNPRAVARVATELGARDVHVLRHVAEVVADVPASAVDALGATPGVESLALDRIRKIADSTSIRQIEGDIAHEAGLWGSGATVAILDTGIDGNHPYLSGRVVAEACFSSQSSTQTPLCAGGDWWEIGPGTAEVANTPACLDTSRVPAVNLCE